MRIHVNAQHVINLIRRHLVDIGDIVQTASDTEEPLMPADVVLLAGILRNFEKEVDDAQSQVPQEVISDAARALGLGPRFL